MTKARKLDRKGRATGTNRHVRLYHWLTDSAAWHDLDANARAIYVEISKRYAGAGSNNGRIPYSVREAAAELKIGKSTAHKAICSLVDHGFMVATTLGAFSLKQRHATEWRLTEHPCDVTHALASKDFMRWTPDPNPTPPGKLVVYLTPNREIEKSASTVRLQVPSGAVAA